jgi:hypothetical protein
MIKLDFVPSGNTEFGLCLNLDDRFSTETFSRVEFQRGRVQMALKKNFATLVKFSSLALASVCGCAVCASQRIIRDCLIALLAFSQWLSLRHSFGHIAVRAHFY